MDILKTRFRSKRGFLEAYNRDLPNGGLFCPTTHVLPKDAQVFVEIAFPGLPNKIIMRGKVLWWRTALPRLRIRAGAMIAFVESEKEKNDFILEIASDKRTQVSKRKHTRIPIEIPVQWRPSDSPLFRESKLCEISIGGALLITNESLRIGDEVVLEFTTPGGAFPISIAGKVTYRNNVGVGLRFFYRDGGGSQRLREVVRRLLSKP